MNIKIASKKTINVRGRASMCCGACCAPMGAN
ncbi:MAG: methanobactin [Methylothermaceae bacterium]|nr:methanobactin [Methylothermaceae bacterium]